MEDFGQAPQHAGNPFSIRPTVSLDQLALVPTGPWCHEVAWQVVQKCDLVFQTDQSVNAIGQFICWVTFCCFDENPSLG